MDLKERDALGEPADRHWYYVSKARMIARYLPKTSNEILDVGAGLGWFSRWLVERGYGSAAICVDPAYKEEWEEEVAGARISYVRAVSQVEAGIILLMDVLEHVDDDVALLMDYWNKAPPGAVFVVTVPAFEFLWSAHDDHLEHRRRYTLASLERTIRAVGAAPKRLHYFFGAIFPLVVTVRLFRRNREAERSDMRPVPPPVNALLTAVCGTEARLARWNRLAGLSVVAQFEKPAA